MYILHKACSRVREVNCSSMNKKKQRNVECCNVYRKRRARGVDRKRMQVPIHRIYIMCTYTYRVYMDI